MSRAIFRGPTKGFVFTDEDVEWLARSMWGEASDTEGRIAVAWAHVQRYLLIRYRWLNEGWSFARYVRGHSQPINPRWRRDGDFCSPGSKYWDNPELRAENCNPTQLNRRDKFQLSPVPADMMELAENFAQGKYEEPFGEPVYDFASKELVARQKRPGPGITIGGNTFINRAAMKPDEIDGIIAGTVSVEPRIGPIPKTLSWILAVPVLLGVGYGIKRIYDAWMANH